jgi:hypothetical protein
MGAGVGGGAGSAWDAAGDGGLGRAAGTGLGCWGVAGLLCDAGLGGCSGAVLGLRAPAATGGALAVPRCEGRADCWLAEAGRVPVAAGRGWAADGVSDRAVWARRGGASDSAARPLNSRRRKSSNGTSIPHAARVLGRSRRFRLDRLLRSRRGSRERLPGSGRSNRREGGPADHLRGSGLVVSPRLPRGEPWRSDALNAPPRRNTGDLLAGCGRSRPPGCLYGRRCEGCQPGAGPASAGLHPVPAGLRRDAATH